MQNTSSTVQNGIDCPAGESIADRRRIRAVDYKPLDIPEPNVPCYCCGKNEQVKRVCWAVFVARAGLIVTQVLDPVVAQQVEGVMVTGE